MTRPPASFPSTDMNPRTTFDFIVIGAGIAGASIAAQLASRGSVLLVEAESQPGYHTTGRSAALYSGIYGNAAVRALSRASRGFLLDPPAGFAQAPLLRPRPTLFFAGREQAGLIERFRDEADVRAATRVLDAAAVHALVPLLAPERGAGGVLDEASADIDVHELHQAWLRAAKRQGAELRLDCRLTGARREGAAWRVEAGGGRFHAPVIVDAAGAWGDHVAALAGATPVALRPLRRTALLVDVPGALAADDWPACIAIDESFYFKPDAGLLLLSPADEGPSEACDAQPEDLDVAIAIDRFEQATGLSVPRVRHRWAGLRVFSPDRTPVVGFDPRAEGFFWFAGQGGYGIQIADALARLGAALACAEAMPADLAAHGVDAAALAPSRFQPSHLNLRPDENSPCH